MFSELAVTYLFFGGAGAGSCVALGILECANIGRYGASTGSWLAGKRRPRPVLRLRKRLRVPHELLSRGWTLCLVLLVTGSLCLVPTPAAPNA